MRAWNGCPYKACPHCDSCGVCMDFHGNFVGKCGEDCPYGWYRRVRDWFRRKRVNIDPTTGRVS